MTSGSITTNYPKELLLIRITSLAWLASKMISWKLWLSDRLFPIVPPFGFVPSFAGEIHFSLLLISLTGLVLAFLFPQKKYLILLVLLSEGCSCFLDQMRWQPWEYQYILTFSFFFFNRNNTKNFKALFALLLIVTYFFSGLHKFSGSFLYSVWDRMILRNYLGLSNELIGNKILHYSGLQLAVIEIITGLGLLFSKNKKTFAGFAIAMHALILLIIGPFGLNHNQVVWPWNIAMIIFVMILFTDKNTILFDAAFFKNKWNKAVVVLIGLLPFLSFFGYWGNYLSFNLYSGNVKQLMICADKKKYSSQFERYVSLNRTQEYCPDAMAVSANKFALDELNVPVYPEEDTYLRLRKEWNKKFPSAENRFVIYYYPYLKEDKKEIPQ